MAFLPSPSTHSQDFIRKQAGGWLNSSFPSGFPLEGEDYGGSRTEEPRPQDLF